MSRPVSALTNMNRYRYEGPVVDYLSKSCVKANFVSETYAVSKKQAKSNICWQYKKAYRLAKLYKVVLPGELTEVDS